MARPPHPFEERKEKLTEQWLSVARDPKVRLLHWRLVAGEREFIETYFAEQNAPGADLPDVFLTFSAPFSRDAGYGGQLVSELKRAASVRSGAPSKFLPVSAPGLSDVDLFLANAGSFYRAYRYNFQHVALALTPIEVDDGGAFMHWLQAAMHRIATPRLKLIVFDHAEAPALAPLANAEPVAVKSITAGLDLKGALEELSLSAGQEAPGAKLRHAFLQASNAAGRGDVEAALQAGALGIALAEQVGAWAFSVGIQFVLAGALSTAGRLGEAVQYYYAAEKSAFSADKQGDPQGAQLRVDARFAIGAVMVGASSFRQAAQWYEQTVPCAEYATDLRRQLEALRMAAYCWERAGEADASWNAAIKGLGIAQHLPDEQRRASTLAYLGEGMLRLAECSRYRDYRRAIDDQMGLLLGRPWRPGEDLQAAGRS